MTAWLPTSSRLKFDDLAISGQACARARRRWLTASRTVRDILSICAHGLVAAHHYEQLKSQSDADLAGKGMRRGDLPRSAFRKLTERF
jgi:hypothetical protein